MTLCWVLTETGCRISEALALTADRVDITGGVVVFESLKKRRRGVFRSVPVSPQLLRELTRVHRLGREPGGKRRLWHWSRMTAYRRVLEVMHKGKIKGPQATPKGLRHGFAVAALQVGIPLNLVQRWMGHADIRITAIYADVTGAEERQIASRMWLSRA